MCRYSGDGARNDSTDKLTWDVTVISPEVLKTSSHINNITLFDASAADDISRNTIWEDRIKPYLFLLAV